MRASSCEVMARWQPFLLVGAVFILRGEMYSPMLSWWLFAGSMSRGWRRWSCFLWIRNSVSVLHLALVSTRRVLVAIQNCPPVLFNAYVEDWCRSVGRPVPVVAAIFDSDLLRRLVREAIKVCVVSVDLFATIEYLAQRLKKFCHQTWLLNLPQFRLCLETGVVPSESLCDVLQELVDNWSDVKICLSNDVLLMRKNINVVDLDSFLCSDRLGLPRLAFSHVLLLCFCSYCKELFELGVTDYACRSFTDFCFF